MPVHIRVVAKGEGKGWSKGKQASDDPRIAKNAAARHGPRGPYRINGSSRVFDRPRPLRWTPDLAYAVGLIATDGCLASGRHLYFDSKDEQLVATFLKCIGRPVRYRASVTRIGGTAYRASISDVELYRWLEGIGLTPAKSLTLGAIDVPDEFLMALVRGLLDGDGSVLNYVHAPTRKAYPSYRYERLVVQFNTASRAHVDWLRARLAPIIGPGYLAIRAPRPPRQAFYTLRYGKAASVALLTLLYADRDAPRLIRKWRTWDDYVGRNGAEGGI